MTDQVNFLYELKQVVADEQVEAVVILRIYPHSDNSDPRNDYGSDDIPNYAQMPFGKILTWPEAQKWLDFKYDAGYGTQECPNVFVWTPTKVIFVQEYDGSTWLEHVPRSPQAFELLRR